LKMADKSLDSFDYIIVGAGSAGCAAAARLVDLMPDPSIQVGLVESGEDYFAAASQPHLRTLRQISNPSAFIESWLLIVVIGLCPKVLYLRIDSSCGPEPVVSEDVRW
jgi:hypothetical protein